MGWVLPCPHTPSTWYCSLEGCMSLLPRAGNSFGGVLQAGEAVSGLGSL